ncbi:hypothetical protein FB45DRAFT_88266 [Roridomyces roridus]|uniref:F-box domain-containing protein n=1 Tax=Roridomyces roridus TaxID=1738132 RepID=A0AAD7BLV4_9AGAR|nr:hypothetical protein FB45DRAFT_88266 [Roridomyces roridus]
MYNGAKLRSCLADVEAQISSLQSQLVRLQADRANILGKLAAVVYPVFSLPNEVTAEIFDQYVAWSPIQGCSPMILAAVCSLWRDVALSTPRVWTRLDPGHHFKYTPLERDEEDARDTRLVELLRMWLPRAGALSVDIRIRLPDVDRPAYAEIFRLLAEHSARLRVLDLFATDGIEFPTGCLGPFPSLTTISFSTHYDEISIPSLLNAPQLREVSFRDSKFLGNSEWQSLLPWTQLTVLRGFRQDILAWLRILEQTPNLELLEFACDDELEETIPTPPVLLPRLHTLILGDGTSQEILPFLNLPALRKFHLETVIGLCQGIVESLVERSACTPVDMYLSVEDLDDMGALRRCLQASPTIKSLEVNCRRLADDDTFSVKELLGLMHGTSGSPLLPAPSSLSISDCPTPVRLSWLVDMLAFRTGAGIMVRLESFKLSFFERHREALNRVQDHQSLDDVRGKLREMCAAGLKVDIQPAVDWLNVEINAKTIEPICL